MTLLLDVMAFRRAHGFAKAAGAALLVGVATLCLPTPPLAIGAILPSYQFNGKGNWSLDAVGADTDPVGSLTAVVPLGSTIEKAFLYSAKFANAAIAPSIQLGATIYGPGAFTPLGINNDLQAYRADVTTQMQAALNGGSAAPVNFLVRELSQNNLTDGEVLAIVYSNPAESTRTIGFLDGYATSAGDTTTITFADPLDTSLPGFEALMSLGISFSFQPSDQDSRVDVSIGARRLTRSAGGQDDGTAENGGLITIGGIGDNPANPNPFATGLNGPLVDDELYNLAVGNVFDPAPFLPNGTTGFSLNTANPSADDLVFFVGINVTAEALIVPEPSSVVLALSGLLSLSLIGYSRRRRENCLGNVS